MRVGRLVVVVGMAALPAACNALLGADAPIELLDASGGPVMTAGNEAAAPQDGAADTAKAGTGSDGSLEASMGTREAAADSPQEAPSASASSSSSSGSGSSSSGSGGSTSCGSSSSGGGAPPPSDDGSFPEGGCKPQTCCDLGINCGPAGDGCGGVVQCGTCQAPEFCGGGGFGVCGAGEGEGGCMPGTCHGLGYDCGMVSDGCGQVISCGACNLPQTCGGGGVANVCGEDD